MQVVTFGSRTHWLIWTTVVIVSAFLLAWYLPRVSSLLQELTSTSIQELGALWAQLAEGYVSAWRPSVIPSMPKLTEVSWRPFDVRRRVSLLAVSHQFTSVEPRTRPASGSERVLCVFRSEQFASLFMNSVKQKELRCRVFHRCF